MNQISASEQLAGEVQEQRRVPITRYSVKAYFQAPPVGLETRQNSAENEQSPKNGAKSGALDPRLVRVIASWEKLDEVSKTVIMRLVDGAATV
jgi:hypothetical protein